MNIRRIKTIIFVLAIVALLALLPACARISQIFQPHEPRMESLSGEISVGVVLPLTGRLASSFGRPMAHGLELARQEINDSWSGGAKIEFITEDDRSTVEGAVKAFDKLTHKEGVSVILGPATSSETRKTFPIAQENQFVAISPTSAARGLSAIGDFVFRVALTTDVLIPSGIEATLAKLAYQRVATIYDESDHFSTDSDEALKKALVANGVEVLATETFRGGDTDFSAQLTRIKALNPDAVFVSALPPDKPGMLIQGRQHGISVPFFVRTLTRVDVEATGAAIEGAITFTVWLSTADTPGNQAFVRNYREKYGVEPNNYAALSYVTLHVLAEAIANAQSTDSIAIRDALSNIRDFDTIFGKFSFDENGDAVYAPKILIVENGRFEVFE